jgi:integrase
VQWFKSAEFGELGEDTRKEHRRRLEEMMREPSSPSTPQFRFGDYPVAKLETKHIKVLRDRKADAPTAANHRLNTLRLLFNWAIDNDNKGGLTHNPGLPVHKLKTSTEGHHTWTDEEREQFKRRWAVGTMARLAYELFFTTGQRLGDVYKFGPHTIQNGTLCFTQEKNGRHNPVPMVLPVPADLQAALNATKTGQATFITKDKAGNPFSSKKSLGTWFKACCAKAELPHCCAHGLRKSSATSHADNGASANELMAIHGWKSLRSAEGYVRKANQKKLAAQAMARVE